MIGEDLIEQFQRDGAVRIPRLFTPSDMAELEAGIDLNLSRLSPRAKVASAATDPGRFVEDFCNWQDNPHYRRFIFDTPLAETAARLMRSTTTCSPRNLPPASRRRGIRTSPTTISTAVRT
jgi:hypothetical protein